jgi:hypothetical protein
VPTRFRIRPDPDEYERAAEYGDRYAAYLDALQPGRAEMPPDLWAYFAEDFFHDGDLTNLELRPEHRRVTFELVCPNVKRFDAPDVFSFVNVGYRVVMDDVWSVALHIDDDGEVGERIEFQYGEIDAERHDIDAAGRSRDDRHHSLTFRANRFWLSVIFAYLSVTPLEPVATELMRADKRYVFPVSE